MKPRSLWACGCSIALLLSSSAARAEWSDWWLTQEQRAQRALDAGQPAQAAALFSDPRRRAYAEIKAGQYAPAAQRLASLRDPEAQYNRGNALARAGDLKGALAAYDAALAGAAKGSTTERDARHNRDLVERQLQKQQQKQQQEQQQSQAGEQQNDGEQSQQKDESQQNAEQSSQGKQQSGQDPAGQSADRDRQGGNERGGKDDTEASQAQGAKNGADAEGKKDDSQAAQEDERSRAAAADERQEQSARATNQDSPPTSERALAVEQWLRQIPDDPGGLLRRKFLLEHRRKQREAQR